jgi:RNA polymerase sigma factor for flagellar operon FliA
MSPQAQYLSVQRAIGPDLVRDHAELVRRIAHHLAARLPPSVEVEDLIQAIRARVSRPSLRSASAVP